MPEYSYRVVYLSRDMSRDAARRILTDHAEHGDWELARLRLLRRWKQKSHPAAPDHTRSSHPLMCTSGEIGKRSAA